MNEPLGIISVLLVVVIIPGCLFIALELVPFIGDKTGWW